MMTTAFAAAALAAATALGAGTAAPEAAASPGMDGKRAHEVREAQGPHGAQLPQLPGAAQGASDEGGGDQLTITVTEDGQRSSQQSWTLECDPAGGTHSDAEAACDELAQLTADGGDPFAPVGQDTMCTQIHGGPAEARVTGEWQGEQVEASFSRANGCEISRWDQVATLLAG